MDTAGREVRVDGHPVELTYTEYELLLYLMTNAGIALSRDRILEQVWRFDYEGDARTVDTHVKKLRSKLGARGSYIRTIRGIGYKFDPARAAGEPPGDEAPHGGALAGVEAVRAGGRLHCAGAGSHPAAQHLCTQAVLHQQKAAAGIRPV